MDGCIYIEFILNLVSSFAWFHHHSPNIDGQISLKDDIDIDIVNGGEVGVLVSVCQVSYRLKNQCYIKRILS